MPRTKKPPGTAVDKRNGRRTELEGRGLSRFPLPRRSPKWELETRRAWDALWTDPVAQALSPVDRPVLLRWADALDRSVRALRQADADPVAKGSMGQPVENPLYGVADKAVRVAQACEAQLGVGALHRARLGIEITSARRSLEDLNREFDERPGAGEPDPDLD